MLGGATHWSGTAPVALVLIALVADALLGGLPGDVITASNIEAVYECPVIVDKNPAAGSPRVSLV